MYVGKQIKLSEKISEEKLKEYVNGLNEDIKKKSDDSNICVLCKEKIEGYGNNAEPLAEGQCCDKCNIKVVEKRISNLIERQK